MNRLYFARSWYGLALMFFGVQHFVWSQFVIGRPPAWPDGVQAEHVFAWTTAIIIIGGGLSVFLNHYTRPAFIVCGLLILCWAGLRNLIQIAFHPEYGALLTFTMKALAIGFSPFIIAGAVSADPLDDLTNKIIPIFARAGTFCLGLFLLVSGVQHFLFPEFVKSLIPAWIPLHTFWTYFSAVALILAGCSIMTGIWRTTSTLLAGLMITAWLFVLHLPRAIADGSQNEWTAVAEAWIVGAVLIVYYLQAVAQADRIQVASKQTI